MVGSGMYQDHRQVFLVRSLWSYLDSQRLLIQVEEP